MISRRLSFGSGSEADARFTAMMCSVLATFTLNGIDTLRWLVAWFTGLRGERRPGARGLLRVAAPVDECGAQAPPHGAGMTP